MSNEIGKVVKHLVAPTTYTVVDDVCSIDVDTSSGGITTINLQPINISEVRRKIYVNDVGNNASVGKIILQANGGNLINNGTSLVLEVDGISAEIEIADRSKFIANLSTDDNSPPIPPINDKNFVLHQTVNATIWNVPHNLNKRCAVQVVDDLFNEIEAGIFWSDNNEVIVTLNKPSTGWVYCN